MKERPILFSAPMVRAILDGSKTQTRRAYKVRKHPDAGCEMAASELTREPQHVINRTCPYGQPGDRLWVRETFYKVDSTGETEVLGKMVPCDKTTASYAADDYMEAPGRKYPSIHMPRWASRILLEVTGVRVERLQDISQSDAWAEGAPPSHPSIDAVSRQFGYADFPRSWYAQLWEQINGPGSWDANPWVWVIEFKRVDAGALKQAA